MGWEKAVYFREMFVGLVRKGTKIPNTCSEPIGSNVNTPVGSKSRNLEIKLRVQSTLGPVSGECCQRN